MKDSIFPDEFLSIPIWAFVGGLLYRVLSSFNEKKHRETLKSKKKDFRFNFGFSLEKSVIDFHFEQKGLLLRRVGKEIQ